MKKRSIRIAIIVLLFAVVSLGYLKVTHGQEAAVAVADKRERNPIGNIYRVMVNKCNGRGLSITFSHPVTDTFRKMEDVKGPDPLADKLKQAKHSKVVFIDPKMVAAIALESGKGVDYAVEEIIDILLQMSPMKTSFTLTGPYEKDRKQICEPFELYIRRQNPWGNFL